MMELVFINQRNMIPVYTDGKQHISALPVSQHAAAHNDDGNLGLSLYVVKLLI